MAHPAQFSPLSRTLAICILIAAGIYYFSQSPSLAWVTVDSSAQGAGAVSGATAPTDGAAPARAAKAGVQPKPQPQAQRRRPPLTAVCVSDTHGLHSTPGLIKVPPGDLLLFPGDAGLGSLQAAAAFSAWLAGLPIAGPRVVTWGNMDTATVAQDASSLVPNATVIVNAIQEISGYRIFASPWTPRFAGAYQLDAEGPALDAYWAALLPPDADVDILLTHGPPYGVADATAGEHRGDRGLLKAVQSLRRPPLLWAVGHIHEQYGAHSVPHPAAPAGIPLLNCATYYAQKAQHAATAQPRRVRLPETEVLPL